MVRTDLEAELGKATVGQGGLVVTTTLDQGIQKSLEDSFDGMFNPETQIQGIPNYAGFENAAATVEDTQTGQISSHDGQPRNHDYQALAKTTQHSATVQPGSTIKPLVLLSYCQKRRRQQNIYSSGAVPTDTKTTFEGNYA